MIWWLALVLPFSLAKDLKSTYLARLRGAKDARKVENLRRSYLALVSNRQVCRIQLDQGEIPSACYKTIGLERTWGLIGDARAKSLTKELDDQCKKSAQAELHSRAIDQNVSEDTELSPRCRNVLRKAHEVNKYRSGEIFSFKERWREF